MVLPQGGAKLLIQHIQLLLSSHDDWVFVKSNLKNVFNSVEQGHMLNQVRGSFPDIYNHATQMYTGVSPLVYLYGKETVIINSQEGVDHGDP